MPRFIRQAEGRRDLHRSVARAIRCRTIRAFAQNASMREHCSPRTHPNGQMLQVFPTLLLKAVRRALKPQDTHPRNMGGIKDDSCRRVTVSRRAGRSTAPSADRGEVARQSWRAAVQAEDTRTPQTEADDRSIAQEGARGGRCQDSNGDVEASRMSSQSRASKPSSDTCCTCQWVSSVVSHSMSNKGRAGRWGDDAASLIGTGESPSV